MTDQVSVRWGDPAPCRSPFAPRRGRCLLLVLALGLVGCGGPSSAASPRPQTGHPVLASALLVLTERVLAGSVLVPQVAAYAQGRQRWTFRLPASGEALAAAAGGVYVGAGATILALDAQTGHLRWPATASPQVRAISVIEGQVYVDTGGGFAGAEHLDVRAPADGCLVWQYRPPDGQNLPVWLVDGGVFSTVVSGFPATLVARDATTGALRFSAPLQIASPLQALLPAGPAALLVVTQDSLIVVRHSDGVPLWRRDRTQAAAVQVIGATVVGFFVDQPATLGGEPLVYLRALQMQDGRLLWQQQLASADEGFLSSGQPLRVGAITPQATYLVDSPSFTTLHAWRLADGHEEWTTSVGGRVDGLLVDGARVYLSADQQLVALQVESGQVRWRAANPDGLTFLQEEAGVLVGVNRLDPTLAGFDPTNGQRLWRLQPQALDQVLMM